ncbi:hypothetical protein ACEQPO_19680 [Bacillus sp. SL00103]
MMIYVRKQGEAERQTQTTGAAAPSGNEKGQGVNVNQADHGGITNH